MAWLPKSLTALFGSAVLALVLSPLVHTGDDPGKYHHTGNENADAQPAPSPERVVHLYGPVDWEMADNIKANLRALDKADPGKPITLVVTSKGGLVPAGLDIIDTMATLKSPVNTLCERWCTSMGAVITAAGDHRSSQPHAIIRFHEVQLDDDAQLRGLEQDHLLEILAAHSHRSREDWAAVFRDGKFISPQQAQQLGALDEIQQPVHRPALPTP